MVDHDSRRQLPVGPIPDFQIVKPPHMPAYIFVPDRLGELRQVGGRRRVRGPEGILQCCALGRDAISEFFGRLLDECIGKRAAAAAIFKKPFEVGGHP